MWPLMAPLVGVVEPTKDLKRGDLAIFMNFSGEGVIFASLIVAALPTFVIFVFAQNVIMRGIVVPVEK